MSYFSKKHISNILIADIKDKSEILNTLSCEEKDMFTLSLKYNSSDFHLG